MKEINSKTAPQPVGPYPHAKRVGSFLFLSGIGPRKRNSKEIPGVTLDKDGNITGYDIEIQCHSLFENINQVLIDSGTTWESLIDITIFLTNIKDDFDKYNNIYKNYFKNNKPTRTTVEINKLPTPIAIEAKCIAYIDNGEENARNF